MTQNADTERSRYRIVTPTQYRQGWVERRGDVEIRHPFKVYERLEDGNYVVFDPQHSDGRDEA